MNVRINLTKSELNYITSSLNNMAIEYRDWAEEIVEDEEQFNDYIESYRICMLLKNRFSEIWEEEECI